MNNEEYEDELDEELDDDWGEDEEEYIVEIEHLVTPGNEDIIAICAEYGISDWKSVLEYNKIKNPLNIKAGDTIIIQKSEE